MSYMLDISASETLVMHFRGVGFCPPTLEESAIEAFDASRVGGDGCPGLLDRDVPSGFVTTVRFIFFMRSLRAFMVAGGRWVQPLFGDLAAAIKRGELQSYSCNPGSQ